MDIQLLVLGALIFVGIHLLPTIRPLREKLVTRLSLNGYKGLFTAISLIGLGLMIWGKSKAPHIDIWMPATWSRTVASLIMLPSIFLLAAAKFPTNIKRITPHPMLWGFILWSVAHLLTNGDTASIILFGSIGAYSVIAIVSANKRGATPSAQIVPWLNEAFIIGFGIIGYVALVFLHKSFFGVALI